MARDLFFPVSIVIVPTVREEDGLAMSSRNRYLNPTERSVAPTLFHALKHAESLYESGERRAQVLKDAAKQIIEKEPLIQYEYISVANPFTLIELEIIDPKMGAILSGAIRNGKTRLIDNLLLNCQL